MTANALAATGVSTGATKPRSGCAGRFAASAKSSPEKRRPCLRGGYSARQVLAFGRRDAGHVENRRAEGRGRPKAKRKFRAYAAARCRCARPFCRWLCYEFRQARSAGCGGKCRRGAAVPRRSPPKPDDPEDGSTFPFLRSLLRLRRSPTSPSQSATRPFPRQVLAAWVIQFMGDMRSRAWLDRAELCILREMPVAGLALSRRNNATAGLAGSAAPGNR